MIIEEKDAGIKRADTNIGALRVKREMTVKNCFDTDQKRINN